MLEREPSRTALAAASYRAVHQVLDQGRIFSDPLALSILGQTPESVRQTAEAEQQRSGMRLFIAARANLAEATLKAGVEQRGVEQLVVLGAGLDTFAYRSPLASRLRIFEVDHPATQAWKRRRLSEAGIAIPPQLVFAPVDFERDFLIESLEAAGLDPMKRTYFMWLGVVPYLTSEAVTATLKAAGDLPGGAEIVFDYSDPPETLSLEMRTLHAYRAARVAAIGEPFLSYFEPADLHALLARTGFRVVEDLGPRAIRDRFVPEAGRNDSYTDRGGHIILAASSR